MSSVPIPIIGAVLAKASQDTPLGPNTPLSTTGVPVSHFQQQV
jgi:hypothetical protein